MELNYERIQEIRFDLEQKKKQQSNLESKIDRLNSFTKGSYYRSLGGLTPYLTETKLELKEAKKQLRKIVKEINKLEHEHHILLGIN